MNLKFLSFLAIALVVASTNASAAPVVLSNPYDVNSTDAWPSTLTNGQKLYVCWSDFYYDGSYEITDFHWSGILFNNNFQGLAGFGFEIYKDNAGLPGQRVYNQLVLGNANATPKGDMMERFGEVYDVYDFSLDLTAPWTASAGTYYFSVFGEFFPGTNAFLWGVSQSQYGADDLLSGLNGVNPEAIPGEGDLAWEVTGNRLNVVPEPATMTLFGLGLLGSTLAARKSKKKNQTNV